MAGIENYNQKIAAFQDSIFTEIDDEIARTLSDANEERKRVIEKAKDDYLNDSFRRVSDETKAIKNACRRRVSKQSFDSNRAVLIERSALIGEFFALLEIKLKNFAKSSDYGAYFKSTLKEADSEKPFYKGVAVQVNPDDFTKEELFEDFPFLLKEASKKIKLGGMAVFYPEENLYIDLTLDKKLKKERDAFVKNSELIIK